MVSGTFHEVSEDFRGFSGDFRGSMGSQGVRVGGGCGSQQRFKRSPRAPEGLKGVQKGLR